MAESMNMRWRIDLHVHTRRYSQCAEALDPQVLPALLAQNQIDGIVITEHDQLWKTCDINALNNNLDHGRIYRGVEVSSRNGHFIIIGLEHMDEITPGISAGALIQKARSQNAAVILAHPQLRYSQTTCQLGVKEMPAGIDAVEVASTVTIGRAAIQAEAFALHLGCTMVGGSDAHSPSQVGMAFTTFAELPADEHMLAAAILEGRCTPGRNPMCSTARKGSGIVVTV